VLICLLVLTAIPVVGYFYRVWQQDRELEAVLAELERSDPRWRMDQLLADRPTVPDAENPVLLVRKIETLLRPIGYDVGTRNQRLFDDPMPPENRLNGMQITALRESFEKHGEALKLARTLKEFRKEGRHTIMISPSWLNTNLDPLQRTRTIVWMLRNDAMLRAEDEDAAGAMESCRSCLVAARSIGREPYLIAALIRFAGEAITVSALERTLAQTEPPEEQLAATQQLLADEIEAPILVEAMRGERAGSDQLIQTLNDGKIKMSALVGGPGRGSGNDIEEWLLDHFPIMVSAGRPEFLRLMNKNVEASKLPPDKQAAVYVEVENEAKNSSAVFVRLLLPAVTKVAAANRRTQAQMRCAMVGLALERYRIKHGRWPKALDELCKEGLLSAVPTDSCDGRPLRYRLLPDGVLVYSVGMDEVDNGGTIDRANLMAQGIDIGFQLWDVSARRQAPLPPRPLVDD
jgi:hypothetical protein